MLTVSSYATRTSPVLRGKWILENACCGSRRPAGGHAATDGKIAASGSLRRRWRPIGATRDVRRCHSRMDPIGFGLENYDGIGAWRDRDGEYAIDASASLPGGRPFHGPEEMKTILRDDRQAFAACVTEKMLTYALGRGLERYDRQTVHQIARRLGEREYRFSALVEEIVESLPFQSRRAERTKS